MQHQQRLAVVSYAAHDPLAPRGVRTRELVSALEHDWDVELHAGSPASASPARRRRSQRLVRAALRRASERVVLDKQEGWSRRRFASWRPDVSAALLIGLPASPIIYAAARLRAYGIPYVVDLGDPWVLTSPTPRLRWPAVSRAREAEREMWDAASGGVFPTPWVAQGVAAEYPALSMLVRPNGYEPPADACLDPPSDPRSTRADATLRFAHFGTIYPVRVDVAGLLNRLASYGMWRRVELHQYGDDSSDTAARVSQAVRIVHHEPIPWSEAIRAAQQYDAGIVIGNRDSYGIPSKAIQYLTLPAPRIAVTSGYDDELARYVSDKPGWLTVPALAPDSCARIYGHLSRHWTSDDLAAPPAEAWTEVAQQIAEFVTTVLTEHVP